MASIHAVNTHSYKKPLILCVFICPYTEMGVGYADQMQQFSLADNVQADYVRKQMDVAVAETNVGNYVQHFR